MVENTSDAVERLMGQYTEIARLAGALAHEIKNPLSTIRLNLQLLAEDLDAEASPAQRRALRRAQTIEQECKRLEGLLDSFLSFAKVRQLELQPTDLNGEIKELLDFFGPEAREAGVEVVEYLDPDVPMLLVDRQAFRGALLNLLLNAKQAMPHGGQLTVATAAEGERAVIHLIDTGVGMDEGTAARMFEAFYSTKPGGSGLGLPTTAKIIDAHKGTIAVETEIDRGTHFTITLPAPHRLQGSTVVSTPTTEPDSPPEPAR